MGTDGKLEDRFYHKTDKDGRPLYIEQLGKLDLNELYKVTTPERQMQSLVVEYEKFQRDRLPICSELTGHLIETSCTIMDLKGVGLSTFYKVKNFVQEASSSMPTPFHRLSSLRTNSPFVQSRKTTTPNPFVQSCPIVPPVCSPLSSQMGKFYVINAPWGFSTVSTLR